MSRAQEELAQAKSQLAHAERGSHSKAEFASLREQLQEARVELGVTRGKCDRAQAAVAKMAEELTTERQALQVATRSTEVFRSEARDLRRQLESRTEEEVGILQGQLTSGEAARVRAERKRDSLTEEVVRSSLRPTFRTTLMSESRRQGTQRRWSVGTPQLPRMFLGGSPSTSSTRFSHHSTGPTLGVTIPPSDRFLSLFFLRKCFSAYFLGFSVRRTCLSACLLGFFPLAHLS